MKEFLSSNNVLFLVLAVVQAIDTGTGIGKIGSKAQFSTKSLVVGVFKKLADWIYIGVGFLVPYVLTRLGSALEIDFSISRTFGWIVLASVLYKEIRSVFDNVSELGVPVPKVLQKAFVLAEKEFDGELTLPTDDASFALNLNKTLPELTEKDTVTLKLKK